VKTYTDGLEYSKRQVIEYEKDENPEMPPVDATDAPEDLQKVIDMVCRKAIETLEKVGIPGATCNVKTIERHVKVLGFERDSPEDLAARILAKADDLARAKTKDEAAHRAFWLGFDVAYATFYGFYKEKRSAGGKNSKRLSTTWAPLLAKYMVNENPKITGKQVYGRLGRMEDKGEPLVCDQWTFSANTDGQIQAENQDGQTDALELSSFEKRYLRPLRK
jgi:hypothetical protein